MDSDDDLRVILQSQLVKDEEIPEIEIPQYQTRLQKRLNGPIAKDAILAIM
mgnify:CR=1 FL=1